jgi:hypothetical protein
LPFFMAASVLFSSYLNARCVEIPSSTFTSKLDLCLFH